jgi:hypothetical protein
MKTPVLGLLVAGLAFAGSTIYLSLQLREERLQADKLADVTRELNARIAELEKSRAESRLAVAGTFGSATPSGGAGMVAPRAAAQQNTAAADVVEGLIVNAPPPSEAFVKMMRAQMRANNKRLYADVGAALGLSKDEANKLIDLLTDQGSMSFQGARDVSVPGERHRLITDLQRDAKAAIVDLIGADKAQSLEEYQKTIPARQELEAISRQLDGADTGLNADQQKRLLAVLVEEQNRYPRPDGSGTSTPEAFAKAHADWQRDYTERVSAEARHIFTSEQLSTYNAYQQWQREMSEQMATMLPRPASRGGTMSFTSASPVAIAADSVELVLDAAPAEKPREAQ